MKVKISISIFLLIVLFQTGYSGEKPQVKKGVLDLRDWNFKQDGELTLDGEWEFYWQQFLGQSDFQDMKSDSINYISVPAYWNDYELNGEKLDGKGYATYRLKILLNDKNVRLAFKLYTISTAYKLYLNGTEFDFAGSLAKSKDIGKPVYYPHVLNFYSSTKEIELIFHISNFHHRKGGPWESIHFGLEKDINRKHLINVVKDFFFAGSILIMALYHLALFFLRRKNKSALIFGLFSLIVVLRILSTGECAFNLIPNFNWQLLVKIEYLSFFLAFVFFSMFIYSLFLKEFSKVVLRIIQIIVSVYSLIVFFTPAAIFSYTISSYMIFVLLVSLYMIYSIIMAVKNKRNGAITLLWGSIILFIAVINDMLYQEEYINTGNFVSLGIFIFLFFQSYLLAARFSVAFDNSEELSEKLNFQNENLENIINDRTKELQRVNEDLRLNVITKDKFFSIIAHDLRSPFNSILGFSELLLNKFEKLSIIDRKSIIESLYDSSKNAFTLLDNLLIWAQSQAKSIKYKPVKILIKDLIDENISLLDNQAKNKRITIITDYKNEIDVNADAEMINTVLRNLISNAIKFTPNSGKINISTFNTPGKLFVSIKDNGIGIAKENIDKLFRIDKNFTTEGTNREKGTGLGLILCKEFIDTHGGDIQVISNVNEGSTFIFSLNT